MSSGIEAQKGIAVRTLAKKLLIISKNLLTEYTRYYFLMIIIKELLNRRKAESTYLALHLKSK